VTDSFESIAHISNSSARQVPLNNRMQRDKISVHTSVIRTRGLPTSYKKVYPVQQSNGGTNQHLNKGNYTNQYDEFIYKWLLYPFVLCD
jgi:hypothetical protein